MLRSAIEGVRLDRNEAEFIRQAMKISTPYNSFRNKLCHGEFTFDGLLVEGKHADRKRASARAIFAVELAWFTERFNEFATLLSGLRVLPKELNVCRGIRLAG